MDAHHRPSSGIQLKATHLIQKVSHFRHKFKLNPLKVGDDSDLHPYSEHHRRGKSEAVDFVTGSQSPGGETVGRSAYRPYMSQPLLKVEEPLVEVQTLERVHGARPEAGEAEPRALPSFHLYDVQQHPASSRQSKHTKPPAIPVPATIAPNHDRTGVKKVNQDVNLNIGGLGNDIMHAATKTSTKTRGLDNDNDDDDVPLMVLKQDQGVNLNIGDNVMHAAAKTSTKKKGLDDDDVPLMVLKQHGSKRNGRSTSAIDLKRPDIVISSFDNGSVRNEEKNGSDRTKEPVHRPFSSSHDHAVKPQCRKAAATVQSMPPPPAPISKLTVPSIGIMAEDSPSPSPSPSPVHLPNSAGASSSSRPRLSLVPLTPLSISPRLSRRISVDKNGNLSTLRFSPSIVTRHPALPLNLPPLPSITPARESSEIQDAKSRKRDSRIGLRSMPALAHSGLGQGAGGHEEEDGDEDDMDDIDEEAEESGHGHSNGSHMDAMSLSSVGSEPSTRSTSEAPSFTTAWGGVREEANLGSNLPQVDISTLDLSFLDESPAIMSNYKGKGKAREDLQIDDAATPTDRLQKDYFSRLNGDTGASSKVLVPNTNKGASTPQAKRMSMIQRRTSGLALHSPHPGFVALKTLPLPPFADAERPGMYKRASQSMVDIHLLKPIEEVPRRRDDAKQDRLGDGQAVPYKSPTKTAPDEEIPPSPKIVRRRRSLPSYYGPSAPPPPYPTFPHWPLIQPREDEGREKLPRYSNDIYLKSILPRKMEFSRPGYQAKDRKWRRVICVLEGTMLRVYRCSPRVAGVSVIEGWWEKKTGVGDASIPTTSYVTATSIIRGPPMRATDEGRSVSPPRNPNKNEEQEMRSDETGTSRPSQLNVPLSEPKRSRLLPFLRGKSHGRSNSEVAMGNPRQRSPRGSLNLPSSTMSGSTVSSRAPSPGPSSIFDGGSVRSTSTVATPDGEEVPEPKRSDLIKTYTLQNAECGLGLDYIKRKNVIRVKMEGEQFLLQAKDAPEVVAWIEGIQSGTNVALDLDERPMPRGPLIPRRRRRRGA